MTARSKNGIVTSYFERVSWRLLDMYRPIIKEMIRGHAGIYALYKRDRLYYVGLATDMMNRVNHHLKDRHKGKWDRFSVYLTDDAEHIRLLEALLLRVIILEGNKVKGRLRGAQDMVRTLKRRMDEFQRDETASLLGEQFVRHRRRSKTKSAKGTLVLARLVERPMPLKAWYKGKEYRASLRRDGHIQFRRELFDSPSAAARAATGRGMRGWLFWHYRDSRGEWITLEKLKR